MGKGTLGERNSGQDYQLQELKDWDWMRKAESQVSQIYVGAGERTDHRLFSCWPLQSQLGYLENTASNIRWGGINYMGF